MFVTIYNIYNITKIKLFILLLNENISIQNGPHSVNQSVLLLAASSLTVSCDIWSAIIFY